MVLSRDDTSSVGTLTGVACGVRRVVVTVFFWLVLNVSSLKGISDGQTNSSLKTYNFLSHSRRPLNLLNPLDNFTIQNTLLFAFLNTIVECFNNVVVS